jgi:hypothetical protein
MEILLRLADALQRQHDLISELRSIATEFDNTVNDIETKTNELQRRFNLRTNLDPVEQMKQQHVSASAPQTSIDMANVFPMPAAEAPFDIPTQFKNGPIRRD